jgi:hypothetical protein
MSVSGDLVAEFLVFFAAGWITGLFAVNDACD